MQSTSRLLSFNDEQMPSASSTQPTTPTADANTYYTPISRALSQTTLIASNSERRTMKFKLVGKDGVEEKFVELELPKSNGILYINF